MHYTEQVQGKQPVVYSGKSDDEPSSGLKETLSESEEVYQHTCIRTGTIARPVPYQGY